MSERPQRETELPAGDERRLGERRAAQADRRFWRALATERRQSERRQPLPPIGIGAPESEAGSAPESAPESSAGPAPESAAGPAPVSPVHADIDGEPARRRRRLRAMLDRADSRQRRGGLKRGERPRFAAGLAVRIADGAHAGRRGTIIDADYITARAEIRFADSDETDWVGFRDLVASAARTDPA